MTRPYDYTIRCNLAGQVVIGDDEVDGDAETLEEARDIAADRLWSEVNDLVLRGPREEWQATFEIVDGNPVREAWDALGCAIVEKDDWRAAIEQAYELLSDFLGIEQEAEGPPAGEICHNCGANMGVWHGEPVMRCPECDAPHTMQDTED